MGFHEIIIKMQNECRLFSAPLVSFDPHSRSFTHQITKVAQRIPGELYDSLCEAAVVADEAAEDGGQARARSVQYDRGGRSLH